MERSRPLSDGRRRLRLDRRDMATGAAVYALGDGAAALLLGAWSPLRFAVLAAAGGTLYAFEIPNYFRWIDRRAARSSGNPPAAAGAGRALRRTLLALLYFNPLWIARHLLIVLLASDRADEVTWGLLRIGALSFAANIPLALTGNFVVQVLLPLRLRFAGSAVFSGLMAVYYAISEAWLRG